VYPDLHLPDGLDAAGFLSLYWQQRPLLMRGALPGLVSPIDADELAGLACESDVESRLVRARGPRGPWQVDHGPFDEETLRRLPARGWTLLVQDVDKHVAEVGRLWERFRFIPEWRTDDIMISYAVDGGSVGPHYDEYDVFLVQASGRRRWRIDSRARPETECLPDLDLRILRRFEPDRDWMLEPGDLLYLPPGVPHWGIAQGPCMTLSVGLRAPAWRELAAGWLEHVAEGLAGDGRWSDPDMQVPADAFELPRNIGWRMRRRIERSLLSPRDDVFQAWLGAMLTEPKDNLVLERAELELGPFEIAVLLRECGRLLRDGRSKMLFQPADGKGGTALLFANGTTHRLSARDEPFLALLCRGAVLLADQALPWLDRPECADLLAALYNAGHFHR
jgi:50S ribosomal protein L16 3-hydroxylase